MRFILIYFNEIANTLNENDELRDPYVLFYVKISSIELYLKNMIFHYVIAISLIIFFIQFLLFISQRLKLNGRNSS